MKLSAFLVFCLLFLSCSKSSVPDSTKIKIVSTTFPQYDWISEILGEDRGEGAFSLSLLIENGTDLHSFQASASDIIKIQTSDVFVYVGGESDEWVEKVLENSKNENLKIVKLLDFIEPLEEEADFHDFHDSCDFHEESESRDEFDEHIWLSVKNAALIVERLCDFLCGLEKNEDKIALYKSNAEKYIEKLSDLDRDFEDAKKDFSKNAILVADRFPFLYLANDYGLNYFAAFKGCSAETEASFETVAFLTKKIDEMELDYVLTIDGGDERLSKTIISNSNRKNCKILTLDSLQSVTKKEIESGKNYLDVMKGNFDVLKTVLN